MVTRINNPKYSRECQFTGFHCGGFRALDTLCECKCHTYPLGHFTLEELKAYHRKND